MTKQKSTLLTLLSLFLAGGIAWMAPAPVGLTIVAWHLLIIFILTIVAIILSPLPMGAITMISIALLVLTKTLTLNNALSGFASPIAWLVVFAFFIARGFIKTGLGKRISYILISRFGKNIIGLSYSLLSTELILSPMIPSSSARGGGIIYPIAKSLADIYSKTGNNNNIAKFLITLCFQGNVICCALFLTSMAGNPLIASIAGSLGVKVTWTNWALGAIIPGIINLILLPYIVGLVIPFNNQKNEEITNNAKESLLAMGKLSKAEIMMSLTFVCLIILWVFGSFVGVDATTAALIGLVMLLMSNVITWDDALNEKGAWETFIWFAALLMMSGYLAQFGVTKWIEEKIHLMIGGIPTIAAISIIAGSYFYIHYFFASVTAHVTVLYSIFAMLLIHLGVNPMVAALGLAYFSNLSGGLTHYGINVAPIYYGAGYFSTREWLKIGTFIASINLLIWLITGSVWWKIIGWW